jgi:phosphoribosylformylglycinamidine synthase
LSRIHQVVAGAPPRCDLDGERALIDALLEAISGGVVASAHDCSDGGLAVALAECCVMDRTAQLGATIELGRWKELPARALLFGEAQGRVIVSTRLPDTLLGIAKKHNVPAAKIGSVRGAGADLQISFGDTRIVAPLTRLDAAFHDAIPTIMSQPAAVIAAP